MEVRFYRFVRALRLCWRYIPIFGDMFDVRAVDHKNASIEGLVVIVAAMLPLIFSTLLQFVFSSESSSLMGIFYENIRYGELFIYTTAMGTPILYFILRDYDRRQKGEDSIRKFPRRNSLIAISCGIILLSSILFSAGQVRGIFIQELSIESNSIAYREGWVFNVSLILFIMCFAVSYITYVYRNYMDSGAARETRVQESSFVERYLERGG